MDEIEQHAYEVGCTCDHPREQHGRAAACTVTGCQCAPFDEHAF